MNVGRLHERGSESAVCVHSRTAFTCVVVEANLENGTNQVKSHEDTRARAGGARRGGRRAGPPRSPAPRVWRVPRTRDRPDRTAPPAPDPARRAHAQRMQVDLPSRVPSGGKIMGGWVGAAV